METTNTNNDLGIAARLRRAKGRPVRSQSIACRFTPPEERELNRAAEAAGMYTAEWGREMLLRAARVTGTEGAVFTELVALRMLLNDVLRPLAIGEHMTPEAYAQVIAEVRSTKHDRAKNLLAQYELPNGGK